MFVEHLKEVGNFGNLHTQEVLAAAEARAAEARAAEARAAEARVAEARAAKARAAEADIKYSFDIIF